MDDGDSSCDADDDDDNVRQVDAQSGMGINTIHLFPGAFDLIGLSYGNCT